MSETGELAIDRGTENGRAFGKVDEHTAELMHNELQSVIGSPDFSRAPIMKRLLTFLVGETASGRGDQLKAYSVAVDGLGRAPDYDARADSYPRVQVGRLRRMLDNHYNSLPPVGGLRLTIPSGRYRVALQPVSASVAATPAAAPVDAPPRRPIIFAAQIAAALVALAIVAALLIRLLPMHLSSPALVSERPTLELVGSGMGGDSDGEQAKLLEATLLNGLGRSSMFDLRRAGEGKAARPAPAHYQLSGDLIDGPRPRLFLRLSRLSPEHLVWSGDISLPAGPAGTAEAFDHALAPVIATIGSANGLVATHELQDMGNAKAVGYNCMLLYHRFRRDRGHDDQEQVQACLDRSLKSNPDDAGLQAAAALFAVERMVSSQTETRDRPALLLTARRHAQIAASVDPQEPWAHIARARIAVLRKACPQAISSALRATQLQPYDPQLLADAGLYLLDCGDPRAEGMIRRAIGLGDDPEGRLYAPLLLLAIGKDNHAMAREALAQMTPPVLGRHGRFYLISATGYAMLGDVAKARAAWHQLLTSTPLLASDPQGHFERLGYAPELREKAMEHLRRAGLVSG